MLLKPEEVSKKTKKNQSFGGLGVRSLSIFGFFETSSGFGKVFNENIAKT